MNKQSAAKKSISLSKERVASLEAIGTGFVRRTFLTPWEKLGSPNLGPAKRRTATATFLGVKTRQAGKLGEWPASCEEGQAFKSFSIWATSYLELK